MIIPGERIFKYVSTIDNPNEHNVINTAAVTKRLDQQATSASSRFTGNVTTEAVLDFYGDSRQVLTTEDVMAYLEKVFE